jgi:hypothetical protein
MYTMQTRNKHKKLRIKALRPRRPRKTIDVSKDMLNLGVQLGVEEIVGGILFTEWMAE